MDDFHEDLEAGIKLAAHAKCSCGIGPEFHVFAFLFADALDHAVGVIEGEGTYNQREQQQDEFPAAVLVVDGAHRLVEAQWAGIGFNWIGFNWICAG